MKIYIYIFFPDFFIVRNQLHFRDFPKIYKVDSSLNKSYCKKSQFTFNEYLKYSEKITYPSKNQIFDSLLFCSETDLKGFFFLFLLYF